MRFLVLAFLLVVVGQSQGCNYNNKAFGEHETQCLNVRNQFPAKLFEQLYVNADDNGVLISPILEIEALSRVYVAAKGKTRTEIEDLIKDGSNVFSINDCVGTIRALGEAATVFIKKYLTLHQGSRLYVDKHIKIQETYMLKDSLQVDKNLRIAVVDFKNHADKARQTINENMRLTLNATTKPAKYYDIISNGAISSSYRLVLVSGIYIKGTFEKAFDKKRTDPKPFYYAPGKSQQVQMMQQLNDFNLEINRDYQILSMPYEPVQNDNTTDMYLSIILPNKLISLDDLIRRVGMSTLIDRARKLAVIDNNLKKYVQVIIPRFRQQVTYELKEELRNLGLSTVFNTNKAEFNPLTNQHISLNSVIQTAIFEVDEGNSNQVGYDDNSDDDVNTDSASFVADRPFIYIFSRGGVGMMYGIYTSKPNKV